MLIPGAETIELRGVIEHYREHGYAPVGRVLGDEGLEKLRARADAITDTRSALAGIGPAEMPAEVAARIDRALADEESTGSQPFDPAAAGNVVPDLSEVRNRRRLPTAPTAAAATVAVLAAVAIVIGVQHKSSNNDGAGISANGAPVEQPLVSVPPSSESSSFNVQSSDRIYSPTTLSQNVAVLIRQDTAAGARTSPVAPQPASSSADSAAGGESGGVGSGSATSTKSNAPGSTNSGRQSARTIHFLCAFSFLAFFLIHIAMVLLSGTWNNLRSMLTGWYAIAGKETGRD